MMSDITNSNSSVRTDDYSKKLSKNDLRKEFKTYELLNFNPSDNKGIYKLLDFYRKLKQDIPKIAEVAELVYCVTASSVPSETLFSYAGNVQDEQRNRIEFGTKYG